MQTVFPTSLRCYATSKCLQHYPELTKKLMDRMAKNDKRIQDLKSYFLKQQKRDFSYIMDINNQFVPEEEKDVLEKTKLLPSILRFVKLDKSCEIGIYQGAMGKIIFLCNAFNLSKEEAIDNHATILFTDVEKAIQKCYCWNFKEGLSGIGWGLIYLETHGFINGIEDLLNFIDQQVMLFNVKRIVNDSFEEGIGGILAYVVTRLGYCNRNKLKIPFDELFIDELKERAELIISKNNVRDYRSYNYAIQLQEFVPNDSSWEILRPELWEVFDFPESINENKTNWSISMQNCLGYGLFVLNKMCKLLNIKNIKHEIKFL